MLYDFIFLVLLSLQPSHGDGETWNERKARMSNVAHAIDTASAWSTCTGKFKVKKCVRKWPESQKQLAMLLVTKGWWESRFARNVHEGKCKSYECDATKLANGMIYHRARTPWQLQKTSFVRGNEWKNMVGTDERSTGIAAVVASRALSSGYNRCGTITGAISSYAGTGGCRWSKAGNRALFWQGLMNDKPIELVQRAIKRYTVFYKAEQKARDQKNND